MQAEEYQKNTLKEIQHLNKTIDILKKDKKEYIDLYNQAINSLENTEYEQKEIIEKYDKKIIDMQNDINYARNQLEIKGQEFNEEIMSKNEHLSNIIRENKSLKSSLDYALKSFEEKNLKLNKKIKKIEKLRKIVVDLDQEKLDISNKLSRHKLKYKGIKEEFEKKCNSIEQINQNFFVSLQQQLDSFEERRSHLEKSIMNTVNKAINFKELMNQLKLELNYVQKIVLEEIKEFSTILADSSRNILEQISNFSHQDYQSNSELIILTIYINKNSSDLIEKCAYNEVCSFLLKNIQELSILEPESSIENLDTITEEQVLSKTVHFFEKYKELKKKFEIQQTEMDHLIENLKIKENQLLTEINSRDEIIKETQNEYSNLRVSLFTQSKAYNESIQKISSLHQDLHSSAKKITALEKIIKEYNEKPLVIEEKQKSLKESNSE